MVVVTVQGAPLLKYHTLFSEKNVVVLQKNICEFHVALSQGVGTKPRRWEVSRAVGSFLRRVKSGIDCPILL
jgi:hypothetical protein